MTKQTNWRSLTKRLNPEKLHLGNQIFCYAIAVKGIWSEIDGGSYYRCDNETKSGLEECRNSKTKADESTAKKEIIAALEGEKKRLTSKKMKLYSDYRTDIISRETYQQEAKQTADRIAEIEQRIPELEKEIEEARMKYEPQEIKQLYGMSWLHYRHSIGNVFVK